MLEFFGRAGCARGEYEGLSAHWKVDLGIDWCRCCCSVSSSSFSVRSKRSISFSPRRHWAGPSCLLMEVSTKLGSLFNEIFRQFCCLLPDQLL